MLSGILFCGFSLQYDLRIVVYVVLWFRSCIPASLGREVSFLGRAFPNVGTLQSVDQVGAQSRIVSWVRKLEDLRTFTWFMMIYRFHPIYLFKNMVLHSYIKLPEGIWSHLSKCGHAGFQLLHQNEAKTSSPMVLNGIKLLANWSSKDGRLKAPWPLSLTGDGHLIAWFLTLATINDSFCWENLQETGWFLPIAVSYICSLALIQWH